MNVMLKFLSLLIVLQIFLQPGSTQVDITPRNYQQNIGPPSPHWPYQGIKNDIENHKQRNVKPCLSRRKFHDTNQELSKVEWVPTFEATATTPEVKDFVPRSLKEEDVGKLSNVLLGTKNSELTFDRKLHTPVSLPSLPSVPSSPISENDCNAKITNQEVFRQAMPNAIDIIDKQLNQYISQTLKPISRVNVAQITGKCNENKDTNLNTRRSNLYNDIPLANEKSNKTEDKMVVQNDENYLSNFNNNEARSYNNYDEQVKTNGFEVMKMSESSVMLMQNSRTCYACSSASNPDCWHPNRRTTVKYCHKGHDACVTKTFESSFGLVLTRDCGRNCEDIILPGVTPNYKSCSICNYDLCNSAYSVKRPFLVMIVILITVVKYSM